MSDLSEEQIRGVFHVWDTDGSGDIDLREFQNAAAALGVLMPNAAAEDAFAKIDTDNSGKLEFNEFKEWIITAAAQQGEQGSSPELDVLFARLMTEHGLRLAQHYTDQVEIEEPKPEELKEAQSSPDMKIKVSALIGENAKNGESDIGSDSDDCVQLRVSLRDAEQTAALRESVQQYEGGDSAPAFALSLRLKDGVSDLQAGELLGRLRTFLEMAPKAKFAGIRAEKVDGVKTYFQPAHVQTCTHCSSQQPIVRIVGALVPTAKTAKLASVAQMASVRELQLNVAAWPPMSRDAAQVDDMALGITLSAALPGQMVDMLSSIVKMKAAAKKDAAAAPAADESASTDRPQRRNRPKMDPIGMIKAIAAMREAGVQFKWDSVADVVDAVPGGALKQFVEGGGWPFVHQLLAGKAGPILAQDDLLPPPIRNAALSAIELLSGVATFELAVTRDVCIGVDFTQFNIVALLPTQEELASFK